MSWRDALHGVEAAGDVVGEEAAGLTHGVIVVAATRPVVEAQRYVDVQVPAGAGHRDVEEAALLFEPLLAT